jgi:RimJ/RimL family protein N-acetyltransferase
VGLRVEPDHRRAELGYWIGVPYWGKGYATEAARALVQYGFETLQLHRIFASHFANNSVSAKVLRKIGMRHEGRQRGHILKWGEFLDIEMYGMVGSDVDGAAQGLDRIGNLWMPREPSCCTQLAGGVARGHTHL